MRRRWIVVSFLAAVVALGIGGGSVLAQSADPDGSSPIRGLVSWVAEILGIEETKVQEAFDRAASEMKEEAVQAKLDAMEESAKITPEQREEWEEWMESMPDGAFRGYKGPGFKAFRFKSGGTQHRGGMSEEQREEWQEWIESKPEGPFQGSRGPGFKAFRFKSGGTWPHDGMTEEQREEWQEWIESKPEGPFHGSRGPFRMFRFNKHRFEAAPPPGGSGDAA